MAYFKIYIEVGTNRDEESIVDWISDLLTVQPRPISTDVLDLSVWEVNDLG